ncbi:MAG: hypothetical protein EOO38_04335 [Cytophagaceae bacterium]|nr:MAG: hypothetical protein EOO38_04335 [Cytophagaceae bacterium]
MLELIALHREQYKAELQEVEQLTKETADRRKELGARHLAVTSKLAALNSLSSDLEAKIQEKTQ